VNLDVLRTGFGLAESPRADDRHVWFTDMALGGVHCLSVDGQLRSWLSQRRMIGGLALNDNGALLCSGTDGIIWLDQTTGGHGTLLSEIDGEPVIGVNDIAADGRGGLLFGTVDHARMFRGEPYFGRSGIYRLTARQELLPLLSGLGFANGLGVSPDGRWVYVNNSGVGTFAYEQLRDGTLGPGRQLSERADCDGLAVDVDGGIWIACISSATIVRLTSDGQTEREFAVQGGAVTSLCFGGADGRDLYVTTAAPGAGAAVVKRAFPAHCTASLLRGRTDVAGMPLARTSFVLPC
jgi:sugar lactone lactonase YvrE